jgi:hypothetical protein
MELSAALINFIIGEKRNKRRERRAYNRGAESGTRVGCMVILLYCRTEDSLGVGVVESKTFSYMEVSRSSDRFRSSNSDHAIKRRCLQKYGEHSSNGPDRPNLWDSQRKSRRRQA